MAETLSTVKQHYDEKKEENFEKRKQSSLFHLRNFNNWVKSVLIGENCPQHAIALDICGGKGGDLKKWQIAKVSQLVLAGSSSNENVDSKWLKS